MRGSSGDDGQAVEDDSGGVEEELEGGLLVGGGLQQVRLCPGQPALEQLHGPNVHVLKRDTLVGILTGYFTETSG
jgi:hypothetical protein